MLSPYNPYEPPETSPRSPSLLWIALAAYVFCFAMPFIAEYHFNPNRFTDGKVQLHKVLTMLVVPPLVFPLVASPFNRKNFRRLLPWSLLLFALPFLALGIITISHHLGW